MYWLLLVFALTLELLYRLFYLHCGTQLHHRRVPAPGSVELDLDAPPIDTSCDPLPTRLAPHGRSRLTPKTRAGPLFAIVRVSPESNPADIPLLSPPRDRVPNSGNQKMRLDGIT